MMRRLTQIALMSVLVLAVASLAAAQDTFRPLPTVAPQPAVRLGNYIEVGNDVFMHIIARGDFRYETVHNWDFESRVRDRAPTRNPLDTREQTGDLDGMWALLRFGVNLRYQKSLTVELVGEERPIIDGNISDARANSSNPGGTDVFGRATTGEDNQLHLNRAWVDYKFQGTPLRTRVGWDLWTLDQAGMIGDNDPRLAVFGEFGDFDAMAAAVIQFESQRIGLENDNDLIYYTFGAGYNLKPHRFQLNVVYARDRFNGADTTLAGRPVGVTVGFTGQKTDSVQIIGSWSGRVGPVRGLVQGSVVTGTARGGTAGLPTGVIPGRDYGILAGSVVASVDADLGVVRPFGIFVFGTADGNPADNRLHGFTPLAHPDITLMGTTTWFAPFSDSQPFARDYACPGRAQGLGAAAAGTPGVASATNPGAPGLARTPANVGIAALGTSPATGFSECSHTVGNPFNDRLGLTSHLGLFTTYGNPGTLLGAVGLRVFPLKGHELTGRYLYRGMVDSRVLEVAFAPELAARGMTGIRKGQFHELGGYWRWTLNPHFFIRLVGNIGIADGGWRDLARLANCNAGAIQGPGAGGYAATTPCRGNDPVLKAELSFQATF